jgi:glycogen operon protein
LYPQPDREPNRSINFVACHDGFTLNDLVSYNAKHNQANLQDNRDGSDLNFSWNCIPELASAAEGASDDPVVEELRLRQIKNFLTILFVSQGTPMLLMGDEVRRTQAGNNNAFCQDNEVSWFDWRLVETHTGLLRFARELIAFTQACQVFREEHFWTTEGPHPRLTWHGVRLGEPDWSDDSRSLAFTLHDPGCGDHLHVIFNAYWEGLTFQLPPLPTGLAWHRLLDTCLPSPEDFCSPAAAPHVEQDHYQVAARSSVILIALSNHA